MTAVAQKDQLSKKAIEKITPKYGAQATIQYKTFLKRTIQEALQNAFVLYKDPTLESTKIGVDYQTTRANFPAIVIKFYERSLQNIGVGHVEWGRTNELEKLKAKGAVLEASTGEIRGLATTEFFYPGKTVVKGVNIPENTFVLKIINKTTILLSQRPTEDAIEDVTFVDVFTEKFIPYHHYIYNGDISLEVYGMSSLDRDRVVDAVVEIIGMGTVGAEGQAFQDRIYATVEASNLPYSSWHFPVVNTDILTDYGEQHELAPWIPEDTWLYKNERRFPVMGEFYSLTPLSAEGSLGYVQEVDLYPWTTAGSAGDPDNRDPGEIAPEDFPNEEIPLEDYVRIRHREEHGLGIEPPSKDGGILYVSREAHHKSTKFEPTLALSVNFQPKIKTKSGRILVPHIGLFPKDGLYPGE